MKTESALTFHVLNWSTQCYFYTYPSTDYPNQTLALILGSIPILSLLFAPIPHTEKRQKQTNKKGFILV